jgi:predicted MFS family arabinose efflux permease
VTYAGIVTPWLLLAFTFLVGCGLAFNNPSWQASVGDLVPRPLLPSAVALNSIGFNLSRSFGPAVGGMVVAAAGAAAAFALNAVSYVGLVVALFLWRPPVRSEPNLPREMMGTALISGLRYVAMSPSIMRVLARSFVFGFSAIVVLALLPVSAAALPDGGPLVYGILLGAFGMGAVGGDLASTCLQRQLGAEWLVRLSCVGFACCASLLAFSTSGILIGLGLLLGGACWVLALSLFNVSVQLSSPRWVLGRALSAYQTVTFGGMALGSWLWGLLAEQSGLMVAFMVAAACLLAGALIGFRFPLPRQVSLDLDPLNAWQPPHVELDIEPRSGPIVVEITYKIRSETTFMRTMAERQRVRRRDGARHWRLLRDMANPDLWIETYESPTWTEYVRHNMRPTKADAAVREAIRALHGRGTARRSPDD